MARWVRLIAIAGLVCALSATPIWGAGVRALADKAGVQLGQPLQFYCQLHDIAPEAVGSYAWDFGEGGTSAEQNPTYAFQEEGTFSITVTVTLKDGKKLNDTITVQAQKECQC